MDFISQTIRLAELKWQRPHNMALFSHSLAQKGHVQNQGVQPDLTGDFTKGWGSKQVATEAVLVW